MATCKIIRTTPWRGEYLKPGMTVRDIPDQVARRWVDMGKAEIVGPETPDTGNGG